VSRHLRWPYRGNRRHRHIRRRQRQGLEERFRNAMDDYIAACAKIGKKPKKGPILAN
jgi:hypothetical protein